MKKEAMQKLLVLGVLAVVVVFIFLNASFNFTGNVVLEDYTTQSDCETAGYTWEEFTEESCTDILDCVECEEGCVGEYTEVLCEEGCVGEYTEVLCETDCQETCEECEDIITGGQCTGDICDSEHLSLCEDETSCTGVAGYWYDSSCNAEEQCIPETCDSLSRECGSADDGCGDIVECGSCNSGYTCNSGTCESDGTVTDDDSGDEKIKTTTIISSNVVKDQNSCTPSWQCGDWSICSEGIQVRNCEDVNKCDSQDGIPETSQTCTTPESCFDKIKNQNEKGVDCGGVCDKNCGMFTIVGSVIEGPIESSKEFFIKNRIIALVIFGIVVLGIGGFFGLKFFLKKSDKGFADFFSSLLLLPKKLPFFKTKV